MTASRSFPHRIVAEQPIAVPPQTAWAVLADFGKVHLWSPSVAHAELISDVASGPGCARACDVRGFGRIEETVTEWRPGEYLAYEATPLGPLGRSHNRWTVTAAPGGCVVRVELSYGVALRPGRLAAAPRDDAAQAHAAHGAGARPAPRARRERRHGVDGGGPRPSSPVTSGRSERRIRSARVPCANQ